jgi:hypothetical protein
MAQFGAKRPRFAPVATTPEGALPTYNYEKAVTIGKLVKADLSLSNASGELYADDGLAEKVDMFASGSLALETDDKTNEVHAAIHGATLNEETSEVTDSDADVAPRGGLTYYKVIVRNGERIFKGVFHPYVSAVMGNDSASTKGSSITFGTSSTSFNVFRCNSGAWRITKEFTGDSAEAACIAWCDEKLGSKAST